MNNEIVNAMEELENWLADPTELGRKPTKIEYTASFEDEDGIKCMIFKIKKNFFISCYNPNSIRFNSHNTS